MFVKYVAPNSNVIAFENNWTFEYVWDDTTGGANPSLGTPTGIPVRQGVDAVNVSWGYDAHWGGELNTWGLDQSVYEINDIHAGFENAVVTIAAGNAGQGPYPNVDDYDGFGYVYDNDYVTPDGESAIGLEKTIFVGSYYI